MSNYSEDILIEQSAISLFKNLGWKTVNATMNDMVLEAQLVERILTEVVLVPKLRASLRQLNSKLPNEAIELAIEAIIRDRSTLSLVRLIKRSIDR